MFCNTCNKIFGEGAKFCTGCGTSVENAHGSRSSSATQSAKSGGIGKTIIGVAIGLFILFGVVYSIQDNQAIESNNNGLEAFDSGNTAESISQFESARDQAATDETKIETLKNLAYAYLSDGKKNQAIATFQEALALAPSGSSNFYLISGEIADAQNNPTLAESSYLSAYKVEPDSAQINNSLALFYADIEDLHSQFVDYPKALAYAKKANSYDVSEIFRANLAIIYYLNEDYDNVIAILKTQDFTTKPHLALWLGYAYFHKDNEPSAKYYFRIAVNGGASVPQEVTDYLSQ